MTTYHERKSVTNLEMFDTEHVVGVLNL